MDQCEAEKSVCYHCKGEHRTGNKACERQGREEVLLEIQEKHKVQIMRAINPAEKLYTLGNEKDHVCYTL